MVICLVTTKGGWFYKHLRVEIRAATKHLKQKNSILRLKSCEPETSQKVYYGVNKNPVTQHGGKYQYFINIIVTV